MLIVSRRLAACALATLGAGALAAVAWGFWSTAGSGTAASVVGTFGEPGAPTLSASNGTVVLEWTPASAPGAGTVDYQVERSGDTGATWTGVCGTTPTARITATTCSDAAGAGTYEWRVTAHYRTWTATGNESDTLNVDNADDTPPTGAVTSP